MKKKRLNKINKNVVKALLFTFLALFIYRLGCSITTPGTTIGSLTSALSNSGLVTAFTMFSGGSLDNYSIFALGVSPYITASIIVQLLSDIIPSWEELKKSGEKGRVKLNRITRWVGLAFAILQGAAMTYTFDKDYSILTYSVPRYYIYVTLILVAGYSATVWIADAITRHGIANGQSMIIFSGIVVNFPTTFYEVYNTLVTGEGQELYAGIGKFIGFIALFVFIIAMVIFLDSSYRKIRIYYSGRSMSNTYQNENSYIPIKVNSASVIPVIFAQAFISLTLIATSYINYDFYEVLSDNWLSFEGKKGLLIYAIIILFFTFLYVDMELDPEEMAKNLTQSNGYILNTRPGKDTEDYLRKTIKRVTVAGGIGLAALALLPYLLTMFTSLSSTSAVMGTGMIIVVGVAMEIINNIRTMTAPSKKPSFL